MNILIDVGHPAHYHVFKNLAKVAVTQGHGVVFTIREKDVTKTLMDGDGVPYVNTGPVAKGARLAFEMLRRDRVILREARKCKADYLFGVCNMMVAQASRLGPGRSIVLNDTEDASLAQATPYPFRHGMWTPERFTTGDWGKQG